MFRLTQAAVEQNDFAALRQALDHNEAIDASGLTIAAPQLASLLSILPRDPAGRAAFYNWRFCETCFENDCSFTGCIFRTSDFARCRFGDNISFRETSFNRARFGRASFGHDATFQKASFGIKADFHYAVFGDRARFGYAKFQAAQFFRVTFGADVGFARVHFTASAKFHNARFGDRANFSEARLPSSCDFGGADFGNKLQMVAVKYEGNVSFQGASIGSRARLLGWRVEGSLNMRSTRFRGEMTLHGTCVREDAIFDHARFDGSADLGLVEAWETMRFKSAVFVSADRLGPMEADKLDLSSVSIFAACLLEVKARVVDLSDARFLAPARIALAKGDLICDRVDAGARLVVTAPKDSDASGTPRLISAQGADLSSVVIAGLDVKALRFRGAAGIDGLQIETGVAFEYAPQGWRTHREVIAEEHEMRSAVASTAGWYPPPCRNDHSAHEDGSVSTAELARIYRGLRKAREDSRDGPGASDFYYGEMEMRRLNAREQLHTASSRKAWLLHAGNLLLLESYRLVGGYGVRPVRPSLLFVGLAIAGAGFVDTANLIHHIEPYTGLNTVHYAPADFSDAAVFVLRSALLLPTSASIVVTAGGEWVQIAARLLGPVLLGLFGFGLRSGIRR
jgi:uncharacterized protein YjbI with pentapeptide repeats